MKEFLERFDRVYDVLYNAGGLIDYGDAVSKFDQMVRIRPAFKAKLQEFESFRQDWITSDREAAAFTIAYFWED